MKNPGSRSSKSKETGKRSGGLLWPVTPSLRMKVTAASFPVIPAKAGIQIYNRDEQATGSVYFGKQTQRHTLHRCYQ